MPIDVSPAGRLGTSSTYGVKFEDCRSLAPPRIFAIARRFLYPDCGGSMRLALQRTIQRRGTSNA